MLLMNHPALLLLLLLLVCKTSHHDVSAFLPTLPWHDHHHHGGYHRSVAPLSASSTKLHGRARKQDSSVVLGIPPNDTPSDIALIFIPGCLLKPQQYTSLMNAVQRYEAIWTVCPALPFDMANPFTVQRSIRDSIARLRDNGYTGNSIFLAGHSLGAVFLPDVIHQAELSSAISGMIQLGSFPTREQRATLLTKQQHIPRLVVTGDLDGLVRVSRIAEELIANDEASSSSEQQQQMLHRAVVVVEGMNHFQVVDGKHPSMKDIRDLQAEIDTQEAIATVAETMSDFMKVHSTNNDTVARDRLQNKVERTQSYLQPFATAMRLEGSYHLSTPCHYCDEATECELDCSVGSPYVEQLQMELAEAIGLHPTVHDEFHESWRFDPLAEQKFFHPFIAKGKTGDLKLETVTEAVYEKSDLLFDGGLFSNTALELRVKFNSVEAILDAAGMPPPPKGTTAHDDTADNTCSRMNSMTIDWAISQVPEIVRERYYKYGTRLKAGKDIPHYSGPSWIWSYLDYSQVGECGDGMSGDNDRISGDDEEECRIVHSHAMKTPVDHPIPFVGGKLYCKLLSPARVLDWIYTDSLRTHRRSAKLNMSP